MKVNIFKSIYDAKPSEQEDLERILDNIRAGRWQDTCLAIAREQDKDKRNELKKKVPYFTPSGVFGERRSKHHLEQHSGFICIDIDEIDNVNDAFDALTLDKHTYSVFKSISHRGLAWIVKIDPEKHLEAFLGLQKYLTENFRLVIDESCKDVSRARFVSYDPDLYLNDKSKVFKEYIQQESKKEFAKRSKFPAIRSQDFFERVLERIDCNITGDNYNHWLRIGFAIASEFGETGEHYFHQVSRFSEKYDAEVCSKQYKYCCRNHPGITIGSFYYYCKQSGIEVFSETDKTVMRTAYFAKTGGRLQESVKGVLETAQIAPSEAHDDIIEAVFENPDNFKDVALGGDSQSHSLNDVNEWLRINYKICLNDLTGLYELDGERMDDTAFNGVYIAAREVFDKLPYADLEKLIKSPLTSSYHPVKQYIDSLKVDSEEDPFFNLNLCLQNLDVNDEDYDRKWRLQGALIKKWYLGIIQTIYTDEPNPLCLVLAGKQRTGKTAFFRRLLPPTLKPYFANASSCSEKDEELLMTRKLLILDDEFSGKSKKDAKRMKRLLSADSFDIREAYGRHSAVRKRIATLCGTCNELEILNDPTGNRRFIPIELNEPYDFELYNSIDKDQLLAYAKKLLDEGLTTELTDEELDYLQTEQTPNYSEISPEAELLYKFFDPPSKYQDPVLSNFMTTTEIKNHIETHSVQRISMRKLGLELRKMQYIRLKKGGIYGYLIETKTLPHERFGG